ncbi:MAG: class I SAM-dependent methyltransferase [Candidatus Eiseniibacteriota bacterium]
MTRPALAEARIREDFDEIARLSEAHGAHDRYDAYLAGVVPPDARDILDVGCGLGRLAARLAAPHRRVTGIDLSPGMVSRAARLAGPSSSLRFRCGDVLAMDLPPAAFDCVISAATFHHLPTDTAVARMVSLLRPEGTLVIHDLRADDGWLDLMGSVLDRLASDLGRFLVTGRLREPRVLREAWARHGAGERYLSQREARALADRLLPGATVVRHRYWRYTLVWRNRARGRDATVGKGAGWTQPG